MKKSSQNRAGDTSWILRLVGAIVSGLGEPLFRWPVSRCDAIG
jgi:hypothetical protein